MAKSSSSLMPPGFRKQLGNQQSTICRLEGLRDSHGIHCSSGLQILSQSLGILCKRFRGSSLLWPECGEEFALTTPPFLETS